MDFKRYLEKSAKELDREVGEILEEQLKEADKTDKKLIPLLKAFTKSCQGGKRIRGTLVVLGFELGKHHLGDEGVSGKAIFKVAAAYEIFHSAILTHDDVIDQSNLRRGKPSLYKVLGGNHYGISQTISLGDYGFFLAFQIISEANFPQNYKIQALGLFSKVVMDTTWGEMLDLEKVDPYLVMKLKTACYTISGPLQVGAVLAGADQNLIKVLGRFGESLGIAFQIQDDILDSEVNFEKRVDYAKKEARKYKNQALKMLPEITKEKRMSKILEQMAEYLINRKK